MFVKLDLLSEFSSTHCSIMFFQLCDTDAVFSVKIVSRYSSFSLSSRYLLIDVISQTIQRVLLIEKIFACS